MFSIKLGKFSTQWYIVDLFGLLGSLQTGLDYLLDHTSSSYYFMFHHSHLVFVINSSKKVNDCCQWMFELSATFLTSLPSCRPRNLRVAWEASPLTLLRGSLHDISWWQELISQSEARVWIRWPMRILGCAKIVTTDASLESFKLSWWKMSYGSLGILPDMHFL